MSNCAEFKPGFYDTSPHSPEPVAPAREDAALKKERDRFLREFWTRALNVNGPIAAQTDKSTARRCGVEGATTANSSQPEYVRPAMPVYSCEWICLRLLCAWT